MDKMGCRANVVQIIAIIDLILAVCGFSLASFQFANWTSLKTGPSSRPRFIKLSLYFIIIIIYIFLLIHGIMGIRLFIAGRIQMNKEPIDAIRILHLWREWSVVYLMALLLHVLLVALLMENGQRKLICLVSSIAQAICRPFGIIIIGKFKQELEYQLPATITKL